MVPFLRWVGGKQRLLGELEPYFNRCGSQTFIDLFCGAGSVSAHFCGNFSTVVMNDINPKLINCFVCVRDHLEEVVKLLDAFWDHYRHEDKEYVYERAKGLFNQVNDGPVSAACLIFLNKTGFNGLYRVNQRGEYNVAFGKLDNPLIYDMNNLLEWSFFLKNVQLICSDFEEIKLSKGDFVYVDPPYVGSETKYGGFDFDWYEQVRLLEYLLELNREGIKILYSNSAFMSHKAWFEGFDIKYVPVARSIAQEAVDRGISTEILVSNLG